MAHSYSFSSSCSPRRRASSADGQLRAQPVAAEQDLLLGSWQLDLVKSRYTPGPPPRSEVRTYVRDNEGMKGTIRRRRKTGARK